MSSATVTAGLTLACARLDRLAALVQWGGRDDGDERGDGEEDGGEAHFVRGWGRCEGEVVLVRTSKKRVSFYIQEGGVRGVFCPPFDHPVVTGGSFVISLSKRAQLKIGRVATRGLPCNMASSITFHEVSDVDHFTQKNAGLRLLHAARCARFRCTFSQLCDSVLTV
jgi:hypothetical protein